MAGHRSSEREEYWREVIRDQEASGLSISAFCREHEVSPASFFSWRRKLAAAGREEVAEKFLPIELAPPTPSAGQAGFEVALPNGLRVFVPPRFDADALRDLLDALGVQAC
jgi:transposase-like protein